MRVLSLLCGLAGTQLVIIMMDANFRTVISAIRSSFAAVPVIFVLAIAVFFPPHRHTRQQNNRVIRVAKVDVMLTDVFINTAVTLALFISRKAYLRRKLLKALGETLKTIRCVVIRAKLQLKPQSSAADIPPPPSGNKESHQQRLKLAPMTISSVDVRDVVLARFAHLSAPKSRSTSIVMYACGVIGAVSTLITRRPVTVGLLVSGEDVAIASAAFISTLLFFCSFAASFHRTLAKSLLRSFDFLFSSMQFALSMLLVSDMMQWDFRFMGALAWLQWFHLALFFDALTPPIKKNLRFQKILFLPVVVATLAGIVFIIYEFFFTDSAGYIVNRTLLSFVVHGYAVEVRTKSLLTIALPPCCCGAADWCWEVAVCPEGGLIFIRGYLEYYTPLPMFPPLVTPHIHSTRPSPKIFSTSAARQTSS